MKTVLTNIYARVFSPIPILSWVLASAVCTFVGPFNTYSVDGFASRLFFWSFIILVAMVLSNSIQVSFQHLFARRSNLFQSAASCCVFTVSYWILLVVFIPTYYQSDDIPPAGELFIVVFTVAAGIFGIVYYLTKSPQATQTVTIDPAPDAARAQSDVAPAASVPEARPPQILKRLGPSAGGVLIRMAMRDHYVEVYTETGQEMVHMRFSDALLEVPDSFGRQVHRSHWVNVSEIKGVERENGKVSLRMSDGALVPVARSRKAELKSLRII